MTNRGGTAYLQTIFAGCFVALALSTVLLLAFLDRQIAFDEIGLYNPSYMLLHYGAMTYPVHLHFDDMTVHPPTHYVTIAFLMKLGLSLFHAAALPPILFFVVAGGMLLLSSFQFPVKVGLLFGTYLAVVIWSPAYTVRPDTSLSMAWIAGLICLEAGRLANWDWKRLFLGSTLLTYAAIVHYPGAFCWIGCLIYLVWICFSLSWRDARSRLASICAGMLVIGLPYLFLFVIPYRHEIREMVSAVQGQGGLAEAIRRHGEVYRNAESYQTMFAGIQPLVQTLLAPLWHWHVPAVFVGVPLLFVFRDARGLALAALPHVLFILFGARHKDPPYFAPEMTLYLASIVTWATAAAIWVVKRIPSRIAPVSIIAICMAGLTLATLREKPASSGYLVRFTRNLTDMDLARAAGLDIAGPNAFIGSTSLGVWYTAGAAHFYNVGPEVLNGPSVSIKPKIFFSRFDGLALDQHRSWVTSNKERIGLTSFYLSGDLHIKGFWFDDRRSAGESQLSWVMYSASSVPVRGYATRGGRMYRFDQAPDGDYTLFSAVCDRTRLPNSGQFDDYLTLYFPLANNDDPRWGLGPRPVIRTLLVSKAQFRKDVLPAAASCKVRDEIPGRIVEVDPNVMLSNLHASDQVIRFYRSFPTALAGSQRLTPTNTVKIPGVVSLADIRNLYSKVILTRRGTAYYLKTTPVLWFDDAAIPIRHRPNIGGGFLHLTGKVLKGVVGISMRGHDPFALIGSEAVWGERDGLNDTYVPVTSFDTLERVVIRNQSQDGESEMLIQDVAAVTEKPPS